MAGLVPSLSATLPPITVSIFDCSAALVPILSESGVIEYREPELFYPRIAAIRHFDYLKGPDDLQRRIDFIVATLKRRQAQSHYRCLRAFADYIVNRSLPAKLCRVAQRLDLAWLTHTMTYIGNKLLHHQRQNCKVEDWIDYRTPAIEAMESLEKVEECQVRVKNITGNQHLFQRYHQVLKPHLNITLIEPDQIPNHDEYYGVPKTRETDVPVKFDPGIAAFL